MRTPDTAEARLSRIEAKLTRLSMALGFDTYGNPLDAVILTQKDMHELFIVFDSMLDVVDSLPDDLFPALLYSRAEQLYNRLIDIRNGRWPASKGV